MNQVTNLVQWKNLTDEQKRDFDFEGFKYEYQSNASRIGVWKPCSSIYGQMDTVYRLVIEDDKWYCTNSNCDPQLGKDINGMGAGTFQYLRPALPDEIPTPEKTLEQKIQEKWPDKEVVMLGFEKTGILIIQSGPKESNAHILAQSMKSFAGYVYEHDNDLIKSLKPAKNWKGKIIQPVAVLFEELEKGDSNV